MSVQNLAQSKKREQSGQRKKVGRKGDREEGQVGAGEDDVIQENV